MAFVDQLINSESSGNPNASITIADGRTFRGLGQLGEARLKEVGMGELFTLEQYENDEDLQRWALDRDIENTKAYIKNNNLGRFVGTEINGVPMTEDNMISVAHLGGRGGLNKYLTSGGSYNPSDELGTSLSDYSSKFAGGPRMAQPSKLDDFAADMKESASTTAKAAEALSKQPPRDFLSGEAGLAGLQGGPRMDHLKKLPGPMQGPQYPGPMQGPQSPGPMQGPQYPGPMQGPQYPGPMQGPQYPGPMQGPTNSTALPNMVRPTIGSGGMPAGAGPMQGPAYPGPMQGPNQPAGGTVSTQGPSQATAPGKTPFMQKMAEMLYPNQDDPEKKFRTTINALGVGLGQMSSGETVDLQPFFNNIATQRQTSIDAASKARMDSMDYRLKEGQLAVSEGTLTLNQAKHAQDMISDGSALDYSSIVAKYPEMTELAGLAMAGDKEAQKQIAQFTADKAAAQLGSPEATTALGDYIKADGNTAKFASIEHLPPEEQAKVIGMGNDIMGVPQRDTEAMLTGSELYRLNPKKFGTLDSAIEHAARLHGGLPGGKNIERIKEDYKNSTKATDALNVKADAAQASLVALDTAERATVGLIEKGAEVSSLDKLGTTVGGIVGTIGGTGWQEGFFDLLGIESNASYDLNAVEAAMMRAIAASYSGQGSISDGERANMAQEVLSGNMSNEQRMRMIGKLKTESLIAQASDRYYNENIDVENDDENWRILTSDIKRSSDAQRELIRAGEASGLYRYKHSKGLDADTTMAYDTLYPAGSAILENAIFPNISEKHARMYATALPKMQKADSDGNAVLDSRGRPKMFPTYIDSQTGEVTFLED